jgi:hypothetical protein
MKPRDIQNVHEEATRIADRFTRHIGARHPAVVHRGGLNGMDRLTTGGEIWPLGDISPRIDEGEVRLEPIIDEDPLLHLNPRVLHEVGVGPNSGSNDHQICSQAPPITQPDSFSTILKIANLCDGRPYIDGNAFIVEPPLRQAR